MWGLSLTPSCSHLAFMAWQLFLTLSTSTRKQGVGTSCIVAGSSSLVDMVYTWDWKITHGLTVTEEIYNIFNTYYQCNCMWRVHNLSLFIPSCDICCHCERFKNLISNHKNDIFLRSDTSHRGTAKLFVAVVSKLTKMTLW